MSNKPVKKTRKKSTSSKSTKNGKKTGGKDEPSADRIIPNLEADSLVQASSRLRDFAENVKLHKDSSYTRFATPAGYGTTVRGLEGGPPCAHYLPENRFEWWDWYHDIGVNGSMLPHGGLAPEAGDTQEEAVNSIFCSTLATLIGTNLDEIRGVLADRISWDSLPVGASPNEAVGIEYSVRTVRSGCVPKMKDLVIRNRNSKLLVNCPADERLEPDQPPPSLIIDFTVPQRAVALEYGWWGELTPGQDYIHGSQVILTAKDRYGDIIISCDGSVFYGGDDFSFAPMAETRVIGISDRNGGIFSVEFEFVGGEYEILNSPFIRRIWHEPFPPAALKQGTMEMTIFGPGDERNTRARTTEHLPFRCDNHIVLSRGFRFEFLGEGHEVTALNFKVCERMDLPRSPGRRIIHIEGDGGITAKDNRGVLPYKVRIYYSIVAWDSSMMDIQTTGNLYINGDLNEAESVGRIIANDPCTMSTQWEAPGTNVCGDVFGAVQIFRAYVTHEQTLEELFFDCSELHRVRYMPESARIGAGRQWPEEEGLNVSTSGPQPWQDSTSLSWGMWCDVLGDDDGPNRWEMLGQMITGFSVIAPQTGPYNFGIPKPLRRSEHEFYITPDTARQAGWEVNIEADMAFVGFSMFQLEGIEDLRAIDFEVKGHSYDGGLISWKMGFEGATGDPGSDDCFYVVAAPCFGALVSRRKRPHYTLYKQDVLFDDGVADVLSLSPSQFGFIRNLSNLPIMITGAEQHGPDSNNFYVLLMKVQGGYDTTRVSRNLQATRQTIPLSELSEGNFIWIAPGDYLCIGGTFYPTSDIKHQARIEFRTNTPQDPILVHLTGTTVESNALGRMFPPSINFGMVEMGSSRMRNVMILSEGPTPLIITSLRIDRNLDDMKARGFTLRGARMGISRKQIQPGLGMPLLMSFKPIEVGCAYAVLVAQTNDGEKRLELRAEGVPRY